MTKGQHKNITNKIQDTKALPEQSYSTIASPGYVNTMEAQENDLKSNLIMMIEAFKEKWINPLKKSMKT